MIALYIPIDALRTSGFGLIDRTMLKTFPARPTAASYSSASGPSASSGSMRWMCGTLGS